MDVADVEPFDIVAPRLVPAGLNRIQRIENLASHFLVVVKPFDQRSELGLEPLAFIPTNRLSPSKHSVVDVLVWIGDYEEEKLSKSASIYIVHATILATNAEPVEPTEKTLRTNRHFAHDIKSQATPSWVASGRSVQSRAASASIQVGPGTPN